MDKVTTKDFNQSQIIIKFKAGQTNSFLQNSSLSSNLILGKMLLPNTYVAKVKDNNIKDLITNLNKDNNIIYAEPDYSLKSQDSNTNYYSTDYKFAFSYPTRLVSCCGVSGPQAGDYSNLISVGDRKTAGNPTDKPFDGLGIYIIKNYNGTLANFIRDEEKAWSGPNQAMGNGNPTAPITQIIKLGGENAYDITGFFWDGLERIYVQIPNTNSILEITVVKETSKSFTELSNVLNSFKFNYTPIADISSDPLVSKQWNLKRINIQQAWQLEGKNTIIVAVIDTGIKSHPDLNNKLWINNKEIPGNSIDDDKNGFIDDVYGIDADTGLGINAPLIGSSGGDKHGTWVAGIIGAETNNSQGLAGICNNCKLMNIKGGIIGPAENITDQQFYVDESIVAIKYAVDNGARVINASWGATWYSNLLQDAVTYAYNNNVVFVAAAGNSKDDIPFYPAAMDHVISVTGINQQDKNGGTNYGYRVDIAAPCSNLMLTNGDPNRLYFNSFKDIALGNVNLDCGTSFAAPHVSGVVALILSKHPEFNPDQIKEILVETADNKISETQYYVGAGVLDAYKAMQVEYVNDIQSNINFPVQGTSVTTSFDIKGTANQPTLKQYNLYYGNGLYPQVWTKVYTGTNKVINGTLISSFDTKVLSKGFNTIKLEVIDGSNNSKISYLRINY